MNRREFIGGLAAFLLAPTLPVQAASQKDINQAIKKLKQEGRRKSYTSQGHKVVSYERELGELTTDAHKYDKVRVGYKEREDNSAASVVVIGVESREDGAATLEWVFDGDEKRPLDGNPDGSFRKSYSLRELLEMINRAVENEEEFSKDVRNQSKDPDYSAKCLYDGAIRKLLK